MKKIALVLTTLFVFIAASFNANAMREPITDQDQVAHVISEYYPSLVKYYEEGLMEIAFLTEETFAYGDTEYNIRYRFVNAYYGKDEIETVLKEKYPNEYILFRAGLLKDVSIFKYVDRETGEIETHLSYNWVLNDGRRHHRPHRFMHR